MKKRFSIKAEVEGTGAIHHIMSVPSADEAYDRLARAYPGRKILDCRAVALVQTEEPHAALGAV